MAKLLNILENSSPVYIVNESETLTEPVTISSNPIESGVPVSDHVQQEVKTLEVTGFILGPQADKILSNLRKTADAGTIVTYQGRVYWKSVLISTVSRNYTQIQNGASVTLTLQNLRRATTPWVKKKKAAGKRQASNTKKSAGTYITVKKGDCYWKWWKRYGTSIATLRAWNKWPDRRIPIGVRARVK